MDKLIDQLHVKIYADGAVLADMLAAYKLESSVDLRQILV